MSGVPARVAFAALVTGALLFFVLVNAASGRGRVESDASGRRRFLEHDGQKRTFLLHVPAAADRLQPRALVLVLHGRGGSGAAVARLTGFAARADSAGFIAVFPDAVTRRWNDGRLSTGPDDVGFLAALVSELAGEYGVDTSRVYVTGMSNGAIMCFRLAAERPGVFAAIAPVAGSMSRQSLDTWQVERPVPVLMVNGTLDPVVRYRGGKELASVVRTARFWVLANGCGPNPETLAVPGPTPGDSTSVTCERWTGKGKSEVLLYTVVGGGHTWPSGGARPARFGPTSRDIDATRLVWEFFTRHRLGETSR